MNMKEELLAKLKRDVYQIQMATEEHRERHIGYLVGFIEGLTFEEQSSNTEHKD